MEGREKKKKTMTMMMMLTEKEQEGEGEVGSCVRQRKGRGTEATNRQRVGVLCAGILS